MYVKKQVRIHLCIDRASLSASPVSLSLSECVPTTSWEVASDESSPPAFSPPHPPHTHTCTHRYRQTVYTNLISAAVES